MTDYEDRLDVASHILTSIRMVYEEPLLFEGNLNERTIAHRLAIHLESILAKNGWLESHPHVDIEYNRVGEFDPPEPKRFSNDLEELLDNFLELLQNQESAPILHELDELLEQLHNRLVYPDIIVHERGEPQNLIVMELKTGSSSEPTTADQFDHSKLAAFTDPQHSDLGYSFGIFLKLKVGADSRCPENAIMNSVWFEEGEQIEENPLRQL